ncbi:hypothetical protein DY000_02004163 [Brassica cretica]|uniref:Uncharacterized protein n=1 Tax=Brassica cretica TaxID=69181 RepID=A0ABQ7BVB9_BRACR|nr:hypothetical protein DY000_02004163 [Brassica cretica]
MHTSRGGPNISDPSKVKFWDRYCTLASFSLCRRQRDDPWITVTSINPRGRVEGVSEPLQPNSSSHLYPTEDLAAVELVVDLTRFGEDDVVHSESEAEIGEYGNDSDSCSSDPSSDSE